MHNTHTQCVDGKMWVYMGADGSEWVRREARYKGNTKTRSTGDIYGPIAHDFEPMAGEISPDMMFCGC